MYYCFQLCNIPASLGNVARSQHVIFAAICPFWIGHHQNLFETIKNISGPDHFIEILQVFDIQDDEVAISWKGSGL